MLNGEGIKKVESYKYLGDIKCWKGTLETCINQRINSAEQNSPKISIN